MMREVDELMERAMLEIRLNSVPEKGQRKEGTSEIRAVVGEGESERKEEKKGDEQAHGQAEHKGMALKNVTEVEDFERWKEWDM